MLLIFKKLFVFLPLLLISIFAVSAQSQQITKFAVVDTAKVYQAYYRNSAPVRNYESKKQEFQSKIDSLIDELQKSFPGRTFTQISYCAGIITLHR